MDRDKSGFGNRHDNMTRLLPIIFALTGCSAPQFEDPAFFHHERPGPVAQSQRDAQRRALAEAQTQRVKQAERNAISKAHREHAKTNALVNMPPIPR
jgi:hypothetical protein